MAIVRMRHPDLESQPITEITQQASSGDSSFTVANAEPFGSSKYVLIGGYESPTAEIRLTGTVSSATAIPITATANFAHNSGESVQHIPYNQIEITYSEDLDDLWDSLEYATLADAVSVATWNSLATIDIQPSQIETIYDDQSDGRSYRWRYKNEQDTIYSDYQAYVLPNGYEEEAVKTIIDKAVDPLNEKVSSKSDAQINFAFCVDQINECLRAVHSERKRWLHDQSFEFVLAEITAGEQEYFLQTNIETKRGIWNLRINDGTRMQYIDKREWDALNKDVHKSALSAQLTSGSSTITFFDTSDFSDSGSFSLWTNGTKDVIRYSANNRSTNTLTLTDTSTDVTVTHPSGTVVWQNATFGVPSYFTVFKRGSFHKIALDKVPNDSIHQKNLEGDVYLAAQQIDSEDDYIRIANPNVVINWLRRAISWKRTDPRAAEWDRMYEQELRNLKRIETTGQKQYLKPRTRKQMNYRGRNNTLRRYSIT